MRQFKLRDNETLYQMMKMYNRYNGEFSQFRKEQNELYDFTVGSLQWDATIRKQLRADGRPANSYNLIRTILNVIFSVERDNRRMPRVQPRQSGDKELSKVVNQTMNYFLYNANLPEASKRVFLDMIIARMGVYHLGWRYNGTEDDIGELFIDSVDPRQLIFEPLYNDPLWEDSAFLLRKHQLNIDEILNTFALNDEEMEQELLREAALFYEREPQKDRWVSKRLKALFSAVYETATGTSNIESGDNIFQNYQKWYDASNGKFEVLELHEKRTERRIIVNDTATRKIVDLTDIYFGEFKASKQKIPDGITFDRNIISDIKVKYGVVGDIMTDLQPRRFQTIVIPAFNIKVDEKAYPVDSNTYVYIPQYCYDYHADPLKVQSVMDDLKDPQADFNKSKSLILELLGRYANKGWIMDENAIAGLEEDWETKKITPYRRVRPGYINMIRPEQGQTISPELVRMPMELQGLMKSISNADNEMRGSASPGVTSGKHFALKEQRQAKSYTYILENRDRSYKALYQTSLDFIQHFATTQQVIRVVGEGKNDKGNTPITINQRAYSIDLGGQIVETILNDIDSEKYDVEITTEPYSVSAQEERYEKLGDLFNATASINQQKADALLSIFVEVGDFPKSEEILQKWEQLSQPSPEEQQMAQMMKQLQMIAAQLGIEEKKADIVEKKARTRKYISDAKRNNINNLLGIQKQETEAIAGQRKGKKKQKAV